MPITISHDDVRGLLINIFAAAIIWGCASLWSIIRKNGPKALLHLARSQAQADLDLVNYFGASRDGYVAGLIMVSIRLSAALLTTAALAGAICVVLILNLSNVHSPFLNVYVSALTGYVIAFVTSQLHRARLYCWLLCNEASTLADLRSRAGVVPSVAG